MAPSWSIRFARGSSQRNARAPPDKRQSALRTAVGRFVRSSVAGPRARVQKATLRACAIFSRSNVYERAREKRDIRRRCSDHVDFTRRGRHDEQRLRNAERRHRRRRRGECESARPPRFTSTFAIPGTGVIYRVVVMLKCPPTRVCVLCSR